ncbi:MAG: sugar-binding protein [Spirochaetota bacterium]
MDIRRNAVVIIIASMLFMLTVPSRAAEPLMLLDEEESIQNWSAFTVTADAAFVKSGKAAAHWKSANANSFPAPKLMVPDWSSYNALAFWMYSGVNNGAQIAVAIGASNEKGKGDDYGNCYFKVIKVEWQGWYEVIIPFSEFIRKGNPRGWNNITWFHFSSGGWGIKPKSDTVLYFDDIRLTTDTVLNKRNEQPVQVLFSCNRPRTAIFDKGSPVLLSFVTVSNTKAEPAALSVRVTDYFDRVISNCQIQADAAVSDRKFTLAFPSLPAGYYEVEAWPMDTQGRKMMPDSCIAASGSQPQGKATFAVMPRTIAENHERSAKLGEAAFFGLHGGYADLGDSLGVTWQVSGNRWRGREPVRPDRAGVSPWVTNALNQPPEPLWNFNMINFSVNLEQFNPAWAVTNTASDYPWQDFEAYFRDEITVEKHRHPHQKTHLYDVAWEINLNSPEMAEHKPMYMPSDVIDIYRRMHPFLRQAEPGAKLLGPCASGLGAYSWTAELFRLGIGKYLDGFNFHGYNAPPPEKSRFPEEIRKLRELIRTYNDGKDMDMYCSELGYRSLYGPTDRSKDHAQWHVRTAIMLKGEGLRVYFPFYGFDYMNDKESWGLTYTLDPARSFRPQAVMPKAAAPALAVCIDQLEGSAPIGDLPWFGSDIYGYFFQTGTDITLAVWSVDAPQRITLPVGTAASIALVDMMGGKTAVKAVNGTIAVGLTQSPIYLHVPPSIYGRGVPAAHVTVSGFPGTKENTVSEPGLYLLSAGDGTHPVRWLAVRSPVEIAEVGPAISNRQKNIEIKVANRGGVDIPVALTIDSAITGTIKRIATVPAGSMNSVFVPLSDFDPSKAVTFSITARSGNSPSVNVSKKINFLAAHRRGQGSSSVSLPNTITWQGTGSSGQKQNAHAELEWDEHFLYLSVETDDDLHSQPNRDHFIWKADGLQLAFDTHPESDEVYNALGGIFTKKITGLDFALTDAGDIIAWRHDTHNPNELPAGALAGTIQADITRDEVKHVTSYRISIPWKEIGLDSVMPGKTIGIDVLINDKDRDGVRRGIELFGEIMRGGILRNYSRFGSFILQ